MPGVFERNLNALSQHQPEMAARLRGIDPAPLAWEQARSGQPIAAATGPDGRPRQLASRYDPAKEAEQLIRPLTADDADTAAAVLVGLGVGYHAARAADSLGPRSVLIIYEPDPARLVAVLQTIDHRAWLGLSNCVLFTGDVSGAELTTRLERFAALLTQGVTLLPHPATRALDASAVNAFGERLTEAIAYCRTNVATALVISSQTARNEALNLKHYHAGGSTDPLHRAAAGRTAVCVAAGPSLARNAHHLADPDLRPRVVVIAAQTALKPLLQRGIRPDFVTALDYSPICARFYEGLPPLPDVTLVAEPKANPAILSSFPGPIRLIPSQASERLIGDLAPDTARVPLRSGSTVAHLSLYLAQHLGCDPILLIGQDLGFSDGLYYCPGTAAHDVWDAELNAFHTIEDLEWIRIARMGGNLQRHTDLHGRDLFSDEQMVTYLRQFERDFAAAAEAGQRIIDCTEGGMPKAHAAAMPFADALAAVADDGPIRLPAPPPDTLDPARVADLRGRLRERLDDLDALRSECRDARMLLREMRERLDDPEALRKRNSRLERAKARVHGELREIFDLVNQMNTLGAFRRARADRRIDQADRRGGQADHNHRMSRQIERDLENMDMLIEAASEARQILGDALDAAKAEVSAPAGSAT